MKSTGSRRSQGASKRSLREDDETNSTYSDVSSASERAQVSPLPYSMRLRKKRSKRGLGRGSAKALVNSRLPSLASTPSMVEKRKYVQACELASAGTSPH